MMTPSFAVALHGMVALYVATLVGCNHHQSPAVVVSLPLNSAQDTAVTATNYSSLEGRSLLQSACDKCNVALKDGGCKCDNNCNCRPGQGGAVCDKCNFPVDQGGCKCDNACKCITDTSTAGGAICNKCNIPVNQGGCKCDSMCKCIGATSVAGKCDKCNTPLRDGGCKCDDSCNCRPGQGGAVCDKCNFPADQGGCKCDNACNCIGSGSTGRCEKCNIPEIKGGCKCDSSCNCIIPNPDPCNQNKSCSACLERAPQCKWCLQGGPKGFPQCQSNSVFCGSWFGSGPQECPSDGGNTKSSFACADISSCDTCLRYAGDGGGQCRWCLTGKQRCMQNVGCDRYCGSCSSWYGARPTECPFASQFTQSVCANRGKPCIEHVVAADETPARIAAMYGTNTWQLLSDNPLPRSAYGARVLLKVGDVLAVRPAKGAEAAKWLWPNTEANLVVGDSAFPRPCSGYATFAERQDCFCYPLPDGFYIWPFSPADRKCRQLVRCIDGKPELDTRVSADGRILYGCGPGYVVHTDLEPVAQCVPEPKNFQCSEGDGCNNIFCFCEEYLLKPGAYLNPFDSTRSTALVCDWTQQGWFGGLIYCPAGSFFDPIARVCSTVSQANRPYRKSFTTCDGVPYPDMPATAGTGKRLQQWSPNSIVRPCASSNCCDNQNNRAAAHYGCNCNKCQQGRNVKAQVAAINKRGCSCTFLGTCPMWFNKNCVW